MSQNADTALKSGTFTRTIAKTLHARYLLALPAEYGRAPERKWPLLMFLHGAGERGSDLALVTKHGPPKLVKQGRHFPFILVAPQCPAGQVWDDEVVLGLLEEIVARYSVDTNRVYLTGLSMGGYGTWSLGVSHPERFAAIVPICGGGDPVKVLLAGPEQAAALRTLPVWAFHGEKDPVVNPTESRRMIDALQRIGAREVKLTTYPEAGHDSWTATYDNPELYTWLLAHSRP